MAEIITAPAPRPDSRETLSALIEQIMQLTPDQQRRLTDVAFGMYLQKEVSETKEAS